MKNQVKTIALLGALSAVLIAIGGSIGAQLLQRLTIEGVPTAAFQGPGETRQSYPVIQNSDGAQYRFVTPGPSWTEPDVARALDSIDQATGDGTLVVLSGSQPPGVAKDFPTILARHVAGRKARLIVDTSGPALHHLVEEPHDRVFVLRMDGEEAEELATLFDSHPEMRIKLVGVIGNPEMATKVGLGDRWLAPLDHLTQTLESERIDLPVVATTSFRRPALADTVAELRNAGHDIAMS